MSNLNEACGNLYAAIIDNIDIDIFSKTIKFELSINNGSEKKNCVLEIKNYSALLWLEKATYTDESYDFSKSDYYELTSIFSEKIIANTENVWLKQYLLEYNIVIEIWESVLLINAETMEIDDQVFQLEPSDKSTVAESNDETKKSVTLFNFLKKKK